ncbi:RWD domain-containing protein [Scheffersomyces coipomensis]|uniref:RWD domain-containing protein n=1 Tax=Scheffersomyces coipomensis TaxID=1788519 RepID=UPI00315D216D
MDPLEEQIQEIEVLQSIYPDELTLINEDPTTKFSILINLDTTSKTRHYRILITIEYPSEYPNEIPLISLEIPQDDSDDEEEEGGYDSDDSDDGEEKLIDFAETIEFTRDDLSSLKASLVEFSEEQIGIPMVFSLVSQLKEDIELKWQEKLQLKTNQYELKQLEIEKIEQQKFQGTKLTPENFNEWRLKFRKEMKIDNLYQLKFDKMHNGKLSGKQIFEQGLANETDDVEVEGEVVDNDDDEEVEEVKNGINQL